MNIVVHENTNLMQPGEVPSLTPEDIKARTYGSKLVLVVEQCMIATIWGCKACLLLMYQKLTYAAPRTSFFPNAPLSSMAHATISQRRQNLQEYFDMLLSKGPSRHSFDRLEVWLF
jgi:hypothetical protein